MLAEALKCGALTVSHAPVPPLPLPEHGLPPHAYLPMGVLGRVAEQVAFALHWQVGSAKPGAHLPLVWINRCRQIWAV